MNPQEDQNAPTATQAPPEPAPAAPAPEAEPAPAPPPPAAPVQGSAPVAKEGKKPMTWLIIAGVVIVAAVVIWFLFFK